MTDGASLFVDFVINSNLTQLVTTSTRIRSGHTSFLLDLVLTNNNQLISNLAISALIGKSDHATVEFQVQGLDQNKPTDIFKSVSNVNFVNLERNLATLDWSDVQ